MLEGLQHWVRKSPDKVYLTQPLGAGKVRDFTWAQADDEIRRMAAHLKSFNWEPGSQIAILAKNSAWWFMADFAIWMAGHVSVPIYSSLAGESLRYILEHSESKALFLGTLDSAAWDAMRTAIPDTLPVIRFPVHTAGALDGPVEAWDDIIARVAPLRELPERAKDELATIVYTSGTTGTPKGVMHNFAAIDACVDMVVRAYGLNEHDRMVSYLPLAHVADRFIIEHTSLRSGAHVFFSESLGTFADDIKRARPTVFIAVPRIWTKFRQAINAKMPQPKLQRLLKIPLLGGMVRKKILHAMGLGQLRMAMSGGAPLAPDLYQWYLTLGLDLLEIYGMTENLGLSHGSRPGGGRLGYVGQPRDGVEVQRSPEGEILIRSAGVMMGYFKDPKQTAEVIDAEGFLRTGDRGEIDGQGYLKLTGRAKEIFKTSKGKYVAPAPIENKLAAHPSIDACCVTGVGFPQPFALVLLAPGTERKNEALTQSLEDLRLSVNETLDPYERLDFLVVVADLWNVENGFQTPSLKIRRAAIEQHYGPRFEQWAKLKGHVHWL